MFKGSAFEIIFVIVTETDYTTVQNFGFGTIFRNFFEKSLILLLFCFFICLSNKVSLGIMKYSYNLK